MKKITLLSLIAVIALIGLSFLPLSAESVDGELVINDNKILLIKDKNTVIINDDTDEKRNIKFSISKKKILYAKKKGEGIFDVYVHNAENGRLEFIVNSGVSCFDLLDVEIPNNNILFCRCDKDKGYEEIRFSWLKDKSRFLSLLGAKFSMPKSADKIIYIQLPPRGAPESIRMAVKLLSLTGNKKIKFDEKPIPVVYQFESEDIGMLSDFVWKDPDTVAFIVAGIKNNKLVVLNFHKDIKNPGKTLKIFDKSIMKIEKLEWVNNRIRITGTNHNGEPVMAVLEI
ncbi:MAG: hypothetical protein CVV21_04690 [Candidatus Goldiibacteriota bacterium HGW-Goldbacteria-1]|jgi:hypothetical protein|nr:MAG: hypothetical protein CVV21_04690 [Candidatus Goldiibacteriota bacterium HGW-Goldbacteria-1]